MNNAIIRMAELTIITQTPKSTLYRWAKKGLFPKPIKLGERCSGWLASEVYEFIDSKAGERR